MTDRLHNHPYPTLCTCGHLEVIHFNHNGICAKKYDVYSSCPCTFFTPATSPNEADEIWFKCPVCANVRVTAKYLLQHLQINHSAVYASLFSGFSDSTLCPTPPKRIKPLDWLDQSMTTERLPTSEEMMHKINELIEAINRMNGGDK